MSDQLEAIVERVAKEFINAGHFWWPDMEPIIHRACEEAVQGECRRTQQWREQSQNRCETIIRLQAEIADLRQINAVKEDSICEHLRIIADLRRRLGNKRNERRA